MEEPTQDEIMEVAQTIVEDSVKKFGKALALACDAAGEARSRIDTLNAILSTKRIWAKLKNQRGSDQEMDGRIAILNDALMSGGQIMIAPRVMKLDRSGFLWDERVTTRKYRSMNELEIVTMPALNAENRIVVPDDRLGKQWKGFDLPTNW